MNEFMFFIILMAVAITTLCFIFLYIFERRYSKEITAHCYEVLNDWEKQHNEWKDMYKQLHKKYLENIDEYNDLIYKYNILKFEKEYISDKPNKRDAKTGKFIKK